MIRWAVSHQRAIDRTVGVISFFASIASASMGDYGVSGVHGCMAVIFLCKSLPMAEE